MSTVCHSALALVTAPAAEPVNLAEAKAFMRIPVADDDALISSLIKAASQELDGEDGWLGRALITQTWDLVLDEFPDVIRVPLPPLQSVTSITYTDSGGAVQVLAPSAYIVDSKSEPGRIVPAYGMTWPSTRDVPNAVTVRFVAGYGAAGTAVPEVINTAIKMLVTDYFSNPSELASKRHADVSMDYRREGAHFPPHIRRMLTPFKVWTL